jgi:serine/threonine-protein kinase
VRHCEGCDLEHSAFISFTKGSLIDGRYRVVRELGRGAMGQVFLAEDVHLARSVALKFADQRSSGRFVAEAAALASLRHPNIVEAYAFGVAGEHSFFAMEYVAGVSVDEIIYQHAKHATPVPMHAATRIVGKVAEGLAAAHARELVHHDVKPANILVEMYTGRPVLVDFGLASMGSRVSSVKGTPAYIAPECCIPEAEIGPLADQYSLACTAFEMLTGELPFRGDSFLELMHRHQTADRPKLSFHRAELEPLDATLQRAFAIQPRDRFPTSLAFARALEDVVQAIPVAPSLLGDTTDALVPLDGVAAAQALHDPALRILVVDDDPVSVKVLTRAAQNAFAGTRIEVARARSGPDALASAKHRMPQLVVLDYGLPDMNGVEVLSRMRALPGGEHLQVLVASGQVGEEQVFRFSVLGVLEFLAKPFDVLTAARRIEAIAQQAGWLRIAQPSTLRPGKGAR